MRRNTKNDGTPIKIGSDNKLKPLDLSGLSLSARHIVIALLRFLNKSGIPDDLKIKLSLKELYENNIIDDSLPSWNFEEAEHYLAHIESNPSKYNMTRYTMFTGSRLIHDLNGRLAGYELDLNKDNLDILKMLLSAEIKNQI